MIGGDLLVRDVRLQSGLEPVAGAKADGSAVDIRIVAGRIAAIDKSLEQRRDEEVLGAEGRVVLPGLHDHHLHLRSLVVRGRSVLVGPTDVAGRRGMTAALRSAPADRGGWRRAVGYHESVAGDLDRLSLDAMVPGARVRVQHRSGVMWIVSSAGVETLGLESVDAPGVERDCAGRVTGRLFRMDGWLAARLAGGDSLLDAGDVSARLAALGVTGITDATPDATAAAVAGLAEAVSDGRVRQRLHLMCPVDVPIPPHPLVTRGPVKVMLDDDRLPGIEELAQGMRRAHLAGAPVAVHCVTAAQMVITVAALEVGGAHPGDRIEHASVVPDALLQKLAALGVTVVINPGLVFERGDTYLDEVDPRDLAGLHRCASLVAAGVRVALSTDAPFGSDDPWLAIAAAHRRLTRSGRPLGPDEAISLSDAVTLFAGHPDRPDLARRLMPGEPGDLCVLEDDALPHPAGDGSPVAATVVGGRVVHRSRSLGATDRRAPCP